MRQSKLRLVLLTMIAVACLVASGCATGCFSKKPMGIAGVPRKLEKVTFPDHIIGPPDILLINGIRLVPRGAHLLEPLDSVHVRVTNTPPEDPIDGVYLIEPDGRLLLGNVYGSVMAGGKTVDQLRQGIEALMKSKIKAFQVTVNLVQSRAQQLIVGEHLVQPNGKIDLGIYGSVHVAGMTTDMARGVIEATLAAKFDKPEVTVKMAAFNTNVYYIITDGGGFGEQVYRLPATGNETVLDALSYINGLPPVASRKRIWIARPGPNCSQVLPVDWVGLTREPETATNYQMMPGDRIYIQAQPIITADVMLARFLSPVERVFGVTLLGEGVVQGARNNGGINTFGGR